MKTKYFDYLPKYGMKIEEFMNLPDLKLIEDVHFYRGILAQKPDTVLFRTRLYAETITKEIAKKTLPNYKNKKIYKLVNELKQERVISESIEKLFTQIRIAGNKAAHGELVTTQEAEQALINIDCIFRFIIKKEYDKRFNVYPEIFDEMQQANYETFERKFIYVTSVENDNGDYPTFNGLEKIGEASVPDDLEADFRPNSDYLHLHAKKRISQYMTTSLLPYQVDWAQLAIDNNKKFFSDRDVHAVLKRSGIEPEKNNEGRPSEWFRVPIEVAKAAINAVKEGKVALNSEYVGAHKTSTIKLRPEQQEAIKQTQQVFKNKDTMLWNAKMRFGKTLSALQLIKNEKFQKVLIMTHRPVVSDGWFEDFGKIFQDNSYIYGSNSKEGINLNNVVNTTKPFIFFASIQDLRGSTWAGGKQGDKNEKFLEIDWDLIIIDEAHEGNETDLAKNVKNNLKKTHTKILELSGTPFNLIDKYDKDNIFTWDYTMEQEAKIRWSIDKPDEPNPYSGLPRVSMYTFDVTNKFNYLDEERAFNFKEFFRVDDDNIDKFVHEKEIKKFLNYITTENTNNNFPFSKKEFRDKLRHTLWLLPGVREARALELLLNKHEVFKEYQIVNIVRDGDEKYAKESDINKVRYAIGSDPSTTRTITLTVRKLTTGVNIPEWTGVFFLSNTESPTSYLQAAFRAQTPFNHEKLGIKKNAYVFDFAPDRALKIISESIGLNNKKGKINTTEQKQKLQRMLNFLPVLGQSGNGMKEFSVDSMLTQLKKVYAEKAVNNGFEDSSLYNDKLLMLNNNDLSKFKKLKGIVGNTEAQSKDFIDINKNGLNQEEFEKAGKAEKKPKKERNLEEEELIKRIQNLRKQRKAMISILRGVSIRIPMMIYGMNVNLKEDIDIEKFIQLVDEKSWIEFMPEGLTKELFREFAQYYDGEIFIEAGRIIRQKAKSYDRLDIIDRTEKIAELFGMFKNPDKETVLTPWRVVNIHLSQTMGGLCFYDKEFENTTKDGKNVMNWVSNDITSEVYKNNTKILDINSKTGLYPLFIATSIYYRKMQVEVKKNEVEFVSADIWKEILRKNIYAIAKTPMAKTITQRTLAGYKNYETKVEYIEFLQEKIKLSPEETKQKIEEVFDNMEFDVVIGNPPYQEEVARKETTNGQKRVNNIFQNFQIEADLLAKKYTTLIYPGKRWIHRSGKGMKTFGLSQLNDNRLSRIIFFPDAREVFYGVDISDGISIVSKNMKKESDSFKYSYIEKGHKTDSIIKKPGERLLVLNPLDKEITDLIEQIVDKNNFDFIGNSAVINQKLFHIESDFVETNPDKVKPYNSEEFDNNKYIKLYTNNKSGKTGRATWFLADKEVIKVNKHLINEWQVVVSSANAGGQKRDSQMSVIDNFSAFGRSRIALKSFETEKEAKNFYLYAQSKFIRFAFLTTDEALSSLGMKVPDILNYNDDNKYIDFEKDIDKQLFELFGLNDKQIKHVIDKVDHIRNK
ncbi:Eco57I restriction-modification methylase domain-containing protein [Staphylococcus shinii]|uniref:Eco57I restriction-modification methylase domain-containing protein n=1 Tax=Staphylococcus shinii TaxID=2912228 RepID=UPI000C3275D7|nr:Eco57I restriction-modification methylase domain-containing protein [Staphylococcus shinii]PKI09559.1 restriction endonuclease [Staphylococcus shinii]